MKKYKVIKHTRKEGQLRQYGIWTKTDTGSENIIFDGSIHECEAALIILKMGAVIVPYS